ncbi:MAG: hypothetical protein AAGI34_18555 [Pseudomonadota bacterium]
MSEDAPIVETRWVRARMEPVYRIEETNRQIGTRRVWKRKGLLGKKVEVEEPVFEKIYHETGKFSDVIPDYQELSDRIAENCEDLERSGYRVISVLPIVEGNYRWNSLTNNMSHGFGGYGYGFGVTRGAIITGRREGAL